MGTYEKEYKVKWLNINPQEKKIEALYCVYANLDGDRKVKIEELIAVISGKDFDTLYNIEIMAFENPSSLGELLEYLVTYAAKLANSDYPVKQEYITKFGTKAEDILNLE
ncbi:MAG: hypothetical protein AB1782_12585 [Cyanobacteriota bacterium]